MRRLTRLILLVLCFTAVSFAQVQAQGPEALPVLPSVDIAVLVENMAGNPSVLGCGHAGVVNTIEYVSELTGEDKIYAVIGGTHLVNASAGPPQEAGFTSAQDS